MFHTRSAAPGSRAIRLLATSNFSMTHLLLTDGLYSLPLKSWRIQIGTVNWDLNDPSSDLVGFRGAGYCGGPETPGGNPGFFIADGVVTGFCGGPASYLDAPFIDFDYLYGPGRFGTADLWQNYLSGTYRIERVVEPGTLALLSLGLLGLGFTARRRLH